jgi:hypothetical protein
LSYRREAKRHDILVRLAGVHGQEDLLKKASGQQPEETPPLPDPDDKSKKPPKKGETPKPPKIKPPAHHEMPVPEIVKKHFEEKHGFANYYFNALNQQRVWKAWNDRSRLNDAAGDWTFSGTLENGGEFRFQLNDAGGSLKLPSSETNWTAGEEFNSSLLPPQSGGLLPALYLWRRLATAGIAHFGAVSYVGMAPVAGHEGTVPIYAATPTRENLAEVLIGSHKDVECRFYFDPSDSRLLALEMYPNEDSDPCEIYFSDYRESDGRFVPGKMEVRYGDDTIALFKLKEFKAEKGEKKNEK